MRTGMTRWLLPFVALATLASYTGLLSHFRTDGTGKEEVFRVSQVIDGDTIIVVDKNGRSRSLRYEGIDCPEQGRENSPGDPFSEEASRLNAKLVSGGTVRVRLGKERYDGFGRLLGFVFSGGVNVNREIVNAGLATVLEIGLQDPELMDELRRAQKHAKENGFGIWEGNGVFQMPRNHEKFVIEQSKAADMAGRRVVMKAAVTGSRSKRNKMVILETDGGVEIVIFGKSIPNFGHFAISPLKHYVGKTVMVVGRVSMYRGKPNVIVRHPLSIQIQK